MLRKKRDRLSIKFSRWYTYTKGFSPTSLKKKNTRSSNSNWYTRAYLHTLIRVWTVHPIKASIKFNRNKIHKVKSIHPNFVPCIIKLYAQNSVHNIIALWLHVLSTFYILYWNLNSNFNKNLVWIQKIEQNTHYIWDSTTNCIRIGARKFIYSIIWKQTSWHFAFQ